MENEPEARSVSGSFVLMMWILDWNAGSTDAVTLLRGQFRRVRLVSCHVLGQFA